VSAVDVRHYVVETAVDREGQRLLKHSTANVCSNKTALFIALTHFTHSLEQDYVVCCIAVLVQYR
jgi:hypothetical protein